MKVFCKEFITFWTRGLVRWLSRKFDSISIDLTPMEDKLDEIKGDVADVKSAVENINVESADQVASFFNITPPVPNAVPMTQQEVEDDLDELWNLIITQ